MSKRGMSHFCVVLLVILADGLWAGEGNEVRPRVRDVGITPGVLSPGRWNSITDVEGVKVGHLTLINGKDIRTGVTAIIPHAGNLFVEKVPAAIYLGNAFGKLMGYTQVEELGNIETPIVLTNTLNVGIVADHWCMGWVMRVNCRRRLEWFEHAPPSARLPRLCPIGGATPHSPPGSRPYRDDRFQGLSHEWKEPEVRLASSAATCLEPEVAHS